MKQKTIFQKLAAMPHIVWMILFIIAPMLFVVYFAFTDADGNFSFANILTLSEYSNVFILSIAFALIATVICLIIGYPLAYFMAKSSPRAQKILLVLLMLPMWCNLLIRTYALMALLDNGGLLNSLLESKRKMKHTAYAALDRLIFTLYLAFADEPRQLSYKDAFGRIHSAQFSRYDFIEYDIRRGEYYYDDSYLFSVDLNGGNEYQREALWERNLENLRAGTLGDPSSPVTLLRYWQCQERAHYPHARENVEYFLSAVENERGDVYG